MAEGADCMSHHVCPAQVNQNSSVLKLLSRWVEVKINAEHA